MNELIKILNEVLSENLPATMDEGGVIKEGFDAKLDEYRNFEKNASRMMLELEEKEKEDSGIETLKIGFNNVFGYYFQIPKAQSSKAPKHFIRKQTLTNAERYYTEELKNIEDNIITSKEKALEREKELLEDLFRKIEKYISELQKINKEIATLDLECSLAQIAESYNWTKPKFDESTDIQIQKGRHPLVEKSLDTGEFVPNDLDFSDGTNFALITGPNMGGKSTYLRQNAILAYLAHIGSFVPAKSMSLPTLDGIYSRIGASDALQEGKSTFMVEMSELSDICHNATRRSFIIVDEIGRGTSTQDGLAIAKSVLEYFACDIGGFTLFATHFFDLIEITEELTNAKNLHVEVFEEDGEVAFLHSIKSGGMANSFGLHVAQKAGLPESIIQKAKFYVDRDSKVTQKKIMITEDQNQASIFESDLSERNYKLQEFLNYDLNTKSPLESLVDLKKLQDKIKNS